jgi:hypothetical protein
MSAGIQSTEAHAHGLSGIVTAAEVDAKLPRGALVWLTFSNHACAQRDSNSQSPVRASCLLTRRVTIRTLRRYIHFAQNWYLSTRTIGRHAQVVIAVLDPKSLAVWRELDVPLLDFSHFGDASDFRGIGSDQARA